MSRPKGRTADCSSKDARNRLKRAEAFLTVAELVLGERIETDADHDEINLSGVAAALTFSPASPRPTRPAAIASARGRADRTTRKRWPS